MPNPHACKVCGYLRGTVGAPLTLVERSGLISAGCDVLVNALGDDIATLPGVEKEYSDARAVFCHLGHPGTTRKTVWARLLEDKAP